MKVAALVGNPNVGKTTLFNALTGSNQYVGNWAGVTIEKKEGFLDNNIKIVDLPGIYAFDTFSNEEKVSKEFLYKEKVDLILNIIDASNLERNLYLTMQLKQFNKPIILILNMIDTARAKGIIIDYKKLEENFNVKVIPIQASKNIGIDNVKNLLYEDTYLIDNNIYNLKTEKESYHFIGNHLKSCISYKDMNKTSITEKIDKVVLNRFLAYPIFFLILILIFKFTFNWVGTPLADFLDDLLNNHFIPFVSSKTGNLYPWLQSLILNGIISGVGSVIVFLPVILTLFLGISFLEDSGYMARAAFIMDKIMRFMGLSGKAFIPMVVGFGCSVPAVMSARTLESEKDRKLAALLVPLMSCNAKLPVYTLFVSIFFKGKEMLVMISLYLLGIIIAFILGILFKNTLFKKDEEPFIIELPEYKVPEAKNLLKHTLEKAKGFLKKAGTIIFSVSIIVWFLSNFNFSGMCEINQSILSSIGEFLVPIFKPLGFGTWQNSVAILTGIMAKEVIVGTMGSIYGSNLSLVLPNIFNSISAFSFLVFILIYTPCISVIATMRKEFGRNFAIFSVFYQVILAWFVSFIVYNLGTLLF